MPGPLRQIIAEGIAGIIRSAPDEAKIIVQVQDLPREKFDALRRGEEATYLARCEIWTSLVPLGADVFLELETRDEPSLRAVS